MNSQGARRFSRLRRRYYNFTHQWPNVKLKHHQRDPWTGRIFTFFSQSIWNIHISFHSLTSMSSDKWFSDRSCGRIIQFLRSVIYGQENASSFQIITSFLLENIFTSATSSYLVLSLIILLFSRWLFSRNVRFGVIAQNFDQRVQVPRFHFDSRYHFETTSFQHPTNLWFNDFFLSKCFSQ